jgi:hypothetical protein
MLIQSYTQVVLEMLIQSYTQVVSEMLIQSYTQVVLRNVNTVLYTGCLKKC